MYLPPASHPPFPHTQRELDDVATEVLEIQEEGQGGGREHEDLPHTVLGKCFLTVRGWAGVAPEVGGSTDPFSK